MITLKKIFCYLASLELTILCLASSLVLVLAGTLAQVHYGIHEVQQSFFESFFVWWPIEGESWMKFPVWPGGSFLGTLLLVNLTAAHIMRFRLKWRAFGIQLIHAGLIIMLAGGVLTGIFSVSGFMKLAGGETKNYAEDSESVELAVIDETNADMDQVTAIPQGILSREGIIQHFSLPFRVVIDRYYKNAQLLTGEERMVNHPPAADHGIGSHIAIQELAPVTTGEEQNLSAAVIEILPLDAGKNPSTYGKWLVSPDLGAPQTFEADGKKWRLEMRAARYYKKYSITLQKFTHEKYPGTDIPKNFASKVTLMDPDHNENRDALIYMNHPLRYQGDTLYQSGFDKNDTATVLQVVHNPGFMAPYIACVIVGVGLLVQFTFHFITFVQKRQSAL